MAERTSDSPAWPLLRKPAPVKVRIQPRSTRRGSAWSVSGDDPGVEVRDQTRLGTYRRRCLAHHVKFCPALGNRSQPSKLQRSTPSPGCLPSGPRRRTTSQPACPVRSARGRPAQNVAQAPRWRLAELRPGSVQQSRAHRVRGASRARGSGQSSARRCSRADRVQRHAGATWSRRRDRSGVAHRSPLERQRETHAAAPAGLARSARASLEPTPPRTSSGHRMPHG